MLDMKLFYSIGIVVFYSSNIQRQKGNKNKLCFERKNIIIYVRWIFRYLQEMKMNKNISFFRSLFWDFYFSSKMKEENREHPVSLGALFRNLISPQVLLASNMMAVLLWNMDLCIFVREYCLKSSAISFVPRNEIYYRFLSLELYTKYHLLMSGLAFGWVAIVFSPPYWWDVRRRVIEWRVKPPVTTNLTRFTVTLNLYETKLNVLYCRLCRCFFHILDWQSIKATFCHVKVGAFSIHRMCLTFARVS